MAESTRQKRRLLGLCIGCGKVPHHSRCPTCLQKNKSGKGNSRRSRKWRLKIRLQVIGHYSNRTYRCACCGESDFRFLQVDHTENNGRSHCRDAAISSSHSLLRWLITNGFPPGFQVLCGNCNHARAIYGQCPHKKPPLPAICNTAPDVAFELLVDQWA